MNKNELAAKIAQKANMTKKDTSMVLNLFYDEVSECMAEGEKVQIIGFGTFETRKRAARTGKNPRTGETMKIPACNAPVFKPGKQLKDKVNK